MQNDLRSRNRYFSKENLKDYFDEYKFSLADALNSVDATELEKAHSLLSFAKKQCGRIFVGGNGGSAAIADHLHCDFTKGVATQKSHAFPIHSLVSSFALFSALANDNGYENTFSEQLKMAHLNLKDTVILISSSGNSPNIIEAAKFTIAQDAWLIGLTGFNGGILKELSNAKLHVDFNNYGIVEDVHQTLMHVIAQYHFAHNA